MAIINPFLTDAKPAPSCHNMYLEGVTNCKNSIVAHFNAWGLKVSLRIKYAWHVKTHKMTRVVKWNL